MTNEPAPEVDLSKQVKKLEQENKTLKVGMLVAIALAVCALIAVMTKAPREISSHLISKDQFGNVRMLAGNQPNGMVGVDLLSARDTKQAGLNVSADGVSSMALGDKEGLPRVLMSVSQDGSCGIALKDKNKVTRASLSLGVDGTPVLSLLDEKGKVRTSLSLDKEGVPAFSQMDEKGIVRTLLTVKQGWWPGINVFNAEGKRMIRKAPEKKEDKQHSGDEKTEDAGD